MKLPLLKLEPLRDPVCVPAQCIADLRQATKREATFCVLKIMKRFVVLCNHFFVIFNWLEKRNSIWIAENIYSILAWRVLQTHIKDFSSDWFHVPATKVFLAIFDVLHSELASKRDSDVKTYLSASYWVPDHSISNCPTFFNNFLK